MVHYSYNTSFVVVKRLVSRSRNFRHEYGTRYQLNCIEKSLKRSNHQRYKTSVAFADFIIGAFVLPIVLVQRYYAAKLQLGSYR